MLIRIQLQGDSRMLHFDDNADFWSFAKEIKNTVKELQKENRLRRKQKAYEEMMKKLGKESKNV